MYHVFIVQMCKLNYIDKLGWICIDHVCVIYYSWSLKNLEPVHNSMDECLDRKVYL